MGNIRQVMLAALGSFLGIATVSFLSLHYQLSLIVPSFGASAVLIYGACHVPMAQPKNVLGGHIISALIAVTVYQLLGLHWWTIALGVTLALVGMMLTDTLHPPGGATAFAAMLSKAGFMFVLTPVAAGALILVILAYVTNNLGKTKKYPFKACLIVEEQSESIISTDE